jgi:tRNA (Thr-GGU) A37 N-methylase
MTFTLRPIGTVIGGRKDPEDDFWGDSRATIVLDPSIVPPGATAGLDTFSHIEVVFIFHKTDDPDQVTKARHPRNNDAWPKVGGLAQRNKARVNRIGVSRCQLGTVTDTTIDVWGLDAIDGTPVFDIKPWMAAYQPRGPVKEPFWVAELMADYYADTPETS